MRFHNLQGEMPVIQQDMVILGNGIEQLGKSDRDLLLFGLWRFIPLSVQPDGFPFDQVQGRLQRTDADLRSLQILQDADPQSQLLRKFAQAGPIVATIFALRSMDCSFPKRLGAQVFCAPVELMNSTPYHPETKTGLQRTQNRNRYPPQGKFKTSRMCGKAQSMVSLSITSGGATRMTEY